MRCLYFVILFLAADMAYASDFKKGPLLESFGPHAAVDHNDALGENSQFKIAFDVAEPAEPGKTNRKFESLARFLNMHVANGVPPENIQLALVVHGKASNDLLKSELYRERFGEDNANAELLSELSKQGVKIHLCGQSASYYKITTNGLVPEAEMSLSAMTAHALLQQKGFTSNPF